MVPDEPTLNLTTLRSLMSFKRATSCSGKMMALDRSSDMLITDGKFRCDKEFQ